LPHYEMGVWAAQQVLRHLSDNAARPEQKRMPCPLVRRESVAAPRVSG
jgi:LacI family transcriptional regulator, galactose operon repressor